MTTSIVALFDFFKKIDNKYQEPEVYVRQALPKPLPTDWQQGLWNNVPVGKTPARETPVAIATTNVELSTQLNEGNKMNMLSLLKAVFAIVKLIEAAFPDSQGKEKFDAALELINEQAGEFVKDKLPLVTTAINAAVSFLHIIGIFKKKAVAA